MPSRPSFIARRLIIFIIVFALGTLLACVRHRILAKQARGNAMLAKAITEEQYKQALANGADVNAYGYFGTTPLMLAAMVGDLDFVKDLISRGANTNARSSNGKTALWLEVAGATCRTSIGWSISASNADYPGCARYLISKGEDVNAREEYGFSAIGVAASHGWTEGVKELSSLGANVNLPTKEGYTPLMFASGSNGSIDSMKVLIDHGANVNARTNMGNTALMTAAAVGDRDYVALLLASGANMDAQNQNGKTSLMLAAKKGSTNCVKILIAHGASAHLVDRSGKTALEYAKGHPDIIWEFNAAGVR